MPRRVLSWKLPLTLITKWHIGLYFNQCSLACYYRRFVRNFRSIARPLRRLSEKTATFEWTVECQEAFAELRCALSHIGLPRLSKPFILDTDASNTGIGNLVHENEPQQERYPQRTLPHLTNWVMSTAECEDTPIGGGAV